MNGSPEHATQSAELYQRNGYGAGRRALSDLPVVDFAAFRGGTAAQRAAVAREIRAACIDIGFFYLVGHGVTQAEMAEAYDRGLQFFHLPLEAKMKTHTTDSLDRQGYIRTGGVDPDANRGKPVDVKERYGIGREVFPGEPEEGRYSAGKSQWPDAGLLPGFREFMTAHMRGRIALAQDLARAFSLSLDLPEHFFDAAYRHLGCSLYLNYYPPLDEAAMQRQQLSASAHTDYGTFTLLSQDDTGGLQVRNAAGDWIEVPPLAGSFVVNIGDLFAMWTNDLFTSNLHRVVNTTARERMSISFFAHPHASTMVSCLETCQGPDNPPRYPPVVAESYMRNLVGQMNRTGRPGISTRTAERLAS